MRKCSYWWLTVSSCLGIFFGITILFVFAFHYQNDAAGVFGLISALFAAVSLHLTLLNDGNRIMTWYTAKNLKALSALALVSSLIALGFTLFYVIYASIHQLPMLPVKQSYYLVAVWSGMTFKWALTVSILSIRQARILQCTTPFLIVQEQE